jgi:hypothetical protein
MTHFRAPWSKSLILASLFATLVCLGVSYALWTLPLTGGSAKSMRFWLVLIPLAVILICALFTVRGYSIANRELAIQRLIWTTQISLQGLREAYFDPNATHRSVRTFGNGGVFFFHWIFSK